MDHESLPHDAASVTLMIDFWNLVYTAGFDNDDAPWNMDTSEMLRLNQPC